MSFDLEKVEQAFEAKTLNVFSDYEFKYVQNFSRGMCKDDQGDVSSYRCDLLSIEHKPSAAAFKLEFRSDTNKIVSASKAHAIRVLSYKNFSPLTGSMGVTYNQKTVEYMGGYREIVYDKNGIVVDTTQTSETGSEHFSLPDEQKIMRFYKHNLLQSFDQMPLNIQQSKDVILNYFNANLVIDDAQVVEPTTSALKID